MNNSFTKKIKSKEYNIVFTNNITSYLSNLLAKNNYSSVFLLYDSNTYKYCKVELSNNIKCNNIVIQAGEKYKNIKTAKTIWDLLNSKGADRKSILVNIGGGALSDIGAFCAATFMRGIKCINIPTTLLAMVDASVGGKTAINLNNVKNNIGLFINPKEVIIDTTFLKTLPLKELYSGWAEVLKHGLIQSKSYWNKCITERITKIDNQNWQSIIYKSVLIKNKIVTQDFKEKNTRKILNAGHTIAHAIESVYIKKQLTHGFCVSLGLIYECNIAWQKKIMSKKTYLLITDTISNIFNIKKTDIAYFNTDKIWALMLLDKKNANNIVLAVLISNIGKVEIDQKVSKANVEIAHKFLLDYLD